MLGVGRLASELAPDAPGIRVIPPKQGIWTSSSFASLNRKSARDSESGRKLYEKMNGLCMSFLGEPIGFMGTLLEDPDIRMSIIKREPLPKAFPSSRSWKNFVEISMAVEKNL